MKLNTFISNHYQKQAESEAGYKLPMIFWNPDGVDAWLHNRKYESLLSLIAHFPQATWLTVGDGRFGSDAYYLRSQGANATPSSISDATLRIAVEKGYLPSYRVENAEQMQSQDNEFDFVLCKESYHHFPRPALAFYEMLRVASRALILIEPVEGNFRLLDWLKNTAIKQLIRGDRSALFEPSGNFIYRVTVREIEKMMTAVNGAAIAVKPFNTFYHPKLASQQNGNTLGAILSKAAIGLQNLLCALRLMNYGLATVIIFKTEISDDLRAKLKSHGYQLIDLPRNPYLA